MTEAEQTRLDAIEECASALDHHALGLDDDYAAAPYLRAADLVRHLRPRLYTNLGPIFLASHDLTPETMELVDDLIAHPGWSVAHHLLWMYERQKAIRP